MKSKRLSEIKGLEEFTEYEIFENGQVFSHKINSKKFLRYGKEKKGYLVVKPRANGKQKTFKVHRLVALAFVDNPDNKPQVNHKDGIKTNNHYSNLEWVTNEENQKHAKEKGLLIKPKGDNHIRYNKEHYLSKKVRQLTLDGEEVAIFFSTRMAARSINRSSHGDIGQCCKGKRKTAYGYKWEFVE